MPEELKKIVEKIGIPKPEKKWRESSHEHPGEISDNKINSSERANVLAEISADEKKSQSSIVAITNAQQKIKEEIKSIEKVLEKDLSEMYLNMTPEKQREFKIKGEETAKEINILLHKTKIQIKKIIGLVRKWLSIIPGINKFFLDQEAKIKADEIMKNKKI